MTDAAAASSCHPASLHIVRVTVHMRPMRQWMGERRLTGMDHALHCLLTETMGETAPRPYRLLVRPEATQATLLGYTSAPGSELAQQVRDTADPLQEQIIPPEGIQSKTMPTEWKQGRSYSFETRVRPLARIRLLDHSSRTKKEIDLYKYVLQKREPGTPAYSREEVYVQWLGKQLARDGAATLEPDTAALVSYHLVTSLRQHRTDVSQGPDAIMRGLLTVQQPEAFSALLTRGLGRHRAYGYGMLLLRPKQR